MLSPGEFCCPGGKEPVQAPAGSRYIFYVIIMIILIWKKDKVFFRFYLRRACEK